MYLHAANIFLARFADTAYRSSRRYLRTIRDHVSMSPLQSIQVAVSLSLNSVRLISTEYELVPKLKKKVLQG